MKLDELEEETPVESEAEEDEEVENDDLNDALELLHDSMVLLGFVGDTNLAGDISGRDRDAMLRQAEEIRKFLDNFEDWDGE